MLSIEERLAALEADNDELKFDLHAAKVAITTLSVFANSLGHTTNGLAEGFKKGLEAPHWQNFDTEEARLYHEELVKRVITLLAGGPE
ncbi:hypothetical protein [Serratia fonticola]|uniref:hypothetical protein n=1 Tax=Serratia fonticola TaxID=47917 RepID=UPI00217A7BD0|nr:hypothetical protein [Serratia fonticola]CAI1592164.1 Uncharacterised protein [Serratia fonticola]CAI1906550.1 Uncharacterised protein [Serratia fonticola]CAI1925600.1 Uncharacterised protein [Serratia fonticola]